MTKSVSRAAGAAALALALGAAGAASAANVLVNGSFEDRGDAVQQSWGGYTYGADFSLPLPGWTVESGSVDITVNDPSPSGAWGPAEDGVDSLDLNGFSAGVISQTVATLIGRTYQVNYWYSRNAAGAPDPATADITVGSTVVHVSAPNDGTFGTEHAFLWKPGSFTFVGSGSDTLKLASTVDGSGGVFFDNLSVAGVPEPASWALMIGGFGLTGAMLRRRKAAFAA